ncbi:hypothetical protein [Peptoniphilus sp.]|jgi:septum formation inhibitor-activating ATPase MinD|uniref:hypothetical protein n=1 Tax=Peptoniphilus sp. TaxID=1971214 RepID=UPI003D943360
MKIIGLIPSIGGIGSTSLAIDLAQNLENTLLIDFNNGFRTIDILINESDIIYDIYDFYDGLDKDLVISKTETFDFLPASQSKDISDFEVSEFRKKIEGLEYENIIIDLPRNVEYIKEISKILDFLIISTDMRGVSKRNLEKIIFESFKVNKKLKLGVFINKINKFNQEDYKSFKSDLKLATIIGVVKIKNEFKNFEREELENIIKFINGEDFSLDEKSFNTDKTEGEGSKDAESKSWIQKIFGK